MNTFDPAGILEDAGISPAMHRAADASSREQQKNASRKIGTSG
jgi:hypothetical protein